ncbi:MAG TPA: PP2C family serine/threonine-protein phosphatase [Pyrinomonadaceae bacterium]|nr:PP2C family serine/threonine-protein phosphatase [Pyrinomonadaceae bacterium]
MSQPVSESTKLPLRSSAVTDRGLSAKRPLNEDSFLADTERGIFSVADGVGGAEAGEVASQTAIEVLDEAFRHQLAGSDNEDLMELAIQRANASIFQMAQDHTKFSMMATTIVGLHVSGNVATIGHVGDSRLYRLTPAGQLLRETEDHSVVEEEVRAGRMTAEQAANHPSKNVISRALGAENSVEVDMKVIEVDDGTQFLLCTDGITRHIPDHELRQVLLTSDDLPGACEELKRRCFERGAEDNLTAVLVCVGTHISAQERADKLDKTIQPELDDTIDQSPLEQTMMGVKLNPSEAFMPPSRMVFPAPAATEPAAAAILENKLDLAKPASAKSGVERTMTRLFVFVLVLVAVAGAFYAGRKYKGAIPYLDQSQATAEATPTPAPTPAANAAETALLKFEQARRSVDADPNAWLTSQLPGELVRQSVATPIDSQDPEFLYLYGRASLLAGKPDEAVRAFESAIAKADLSPSPANATLRKEAAFGIAAAALKFEAARPAALRHFDEATRPVQPAPASSPLSSPLASP